MAPRFTDERLIAHGAIADVFLATMLEGPEPIVVVVKRLRPDLRDVENVAQTFLREMDLASWLRHPNIVRVLTTGLDDDTPFFAMDHLSGVTLHHALQRLHQRREKMHAGVACAIAGGIARALEYAHTRADASGAPLGIVHRDVTPDNVFLTDDGGVKLLDFGIAYVASAVRLTRSGFVKGKIDYMSPEQLMGIDVDARADIFALGVLFWEMLSGRHPWRPLDPTRMARAIREEPAIAPSTRASGVPPSLDALVMGMLAKFSSGRPDRMAIVTTRLDQIGVELLGGRSAERQIAALVSSTAG